MPLRLLMFSFSFISSSFLFAIFDLDFASYLRSFRLPAGKSRCLNNSTCIYQKYCCICLYAHACKVHAGEVHTLHVARLSRALLSFGVVCLLFICHCSQLVSFRVSIGNITGQHDLIVDDCQLWSACISFPFFCSPSFVFIFFFYSSASSHDLKNNSDKILRLSAIPIRG